MKAMSESVSCYLKTLSCLRSSETHGDEVFLKIDSKKVWPHYPYGKIKSNGELPINLNVLPDGSGLVKIELWEKDFFSDTLLGYFQFVPIGASGKYSTDLKLKDKRGLYRYTLLWEM
jgi:hypothetical protein